MKNLIVSMVLSAMFAVSLSADYKLILTDKDGNQTEECIKSYSFSNNLESIAKQQGLTKDIYSEEEVMTHKVYMGKPVYRKVMKIADFSVPQSATPVRRYTQSVTDLERVTDMEFHAIRAHDNLMISSNYSHYTLFNDGTNVLFRGEFSYDTKKAAIFIRQNITPSVWQIKDATVTLEYTKTTDSTNTVSNEFKSYLHYLSSSSTTEELVDVNLKNMGIQFLEGYTYDSATNSCNPN
jgi:hypothetical protein